MVFVSYFVVFETRLGMCPPSMIADIAGGLNVSVGGTWAWRGEAEFWRTPTHMREGCGPTQAVCRCVGVFRVD